jgi:large subunit ribosomal protein L21|tara:strand:+ start:1270 stop:1641 length:372 start_codon:yes stop_codon:yes gene_type:complete
MFAIANVAGFQEKLEEGKKLFVPTLKAEEGKTVTFDTVYLLAKSDSDVKVGTPTVSGASVEAKVLNHGRGDKIRVFKMKRRKRYRRTYGHRQGYTEIEVTKIKSSGAAKAAPKKTVKKESEES